MTFNQLKIQNDAKTSLWDLISLLREPFGRIFLCCLFAFLSSSSFAQTSSKTLQGEVTFITSGNVYVKVDDTKRINVGDSLMSANTGQPVLVVTAKSSRSLVCSSLDGYTAKKGDQITFNAKDLGEKVVQENVEEVTNEEKEPGFFSNIATQEEPDANRRKETFRGRISVSNYQNIASNRANRNRLMSRLWLQAKNIKHSKFSAEAQINYRQIFLQPTIERPTQYFNVYNLAVSYEASPELKVVLGRKINPKVASIGPIDGLQGEYYFGGNNYVGAIVGFRPDISTLNPNFNLLEYGAYVGRESSKPNLFSQTTLGLIEQRNGGNIDRRYAYFQHSSTIQRNFSLFSSLELDVYQSVNGVVSSKVRIPNLFVSGTYRFGRKASLMLSYDSRKRVLFYETFQTEIERLLDDDLAREGIRTRLSFRPIKYMYAGVSFSRRFQNDQQNKSDNIHASISYSKLPVVQGRLSVTYNRNNSNYLNSEILSIRHGRNLVPNKLDADFYYRMAGYTFVNSDRVRRQHYYGANLTIHLPKKWGLQLAIERSDFNQEAYNRIYARIIKRFYRTR